MSENSATLPGGAARWIEKNWKTSHILCTGKQQYPLNINALNAYSEVQNHQSGAPEARWSSWRMVVQRKDPANANVKYVGRR